MFTGLVVNLVMDRAIRNRRVSSARERVKWASKIFSVVSAVDQVGRHADLVADRAVVRVKIRVKIPIIFHGFSSILPKLIPDK
jgi:hypothetical protein